MLLARHLHNRAAALLGLILIALSIETIPSDGLAHLLDQDTFLMVSALTTIVRSACIGYFWPWLCLEISGGPANRRQARLTQVMAGVFAALPIISVWAGAFAYLNLLSAAVWVFVIVGNQLFGYWILARNYRRNAAAGRNRIKIVFFAFFFFMLSGLAAVAATVLGVPLAGPFIPGTALVGAALLAYAALRRNLFDFNFALNRTLVYATVSFVVLAAFGLAEWAIEHLVPEAWHEGSAFFSAGIALALFLSFHRLRDWVEHHVERLLFRSWHDNEAALRRFVASAAHFDSSPALCRAFAEELRRFAHGAGATLYVNEPGGGYRLCAGKLAGARKSHDGDDRALALMRAEREPVRLAQAHSALPGELALPMLDQGRLVGFALLARKPDGTDYRPDEVEVLGWAAHQVGLALQAQHARELEARVAGMGATIMALSADRDRLEGLLAGTRVAAQ